MLVAVYGTLRKGLSNHGLLKNAEYIGTYETLPEYKMVDLGAYPGLLENGSTSITMEVFKVTDIELGSLDQLEGYDANDAEHTFYERIIINTPFGKAFTYLYKGQFGGADIVTTGDWNDYYKLKQVMRHYV